MAEQAEPPPPSDNVSAQEVVTPNYTAVVNLLAWAVPCISLLRPGPWRNVCPVSSFNCGYAAEKRGSRTR